MTQPESRTVEERLAAVIREVFRARVSVVPEALALAILAAAKEHGLVIGEGELDAAWKEAEAALPEGWRIEGVRGPGKWVASAEPSPANKRHGSGVMWLGRGAEGPTPAAALHALAERLRR